jgi:hypothetical protein
MEEKSYSFSLVRTEFRYEFLSISAEKAVKKVVLFTETSSSMVYNLALLDELENGELSDISETNNNDLVTVMATVIQIIDEFLRIKPDCFVIFKGSDERRQRLYRIIISRELFKIQQKFDIFGGIGDDFITDFEPNKKYDFYIIRQKNENS